MRLELISFLILYFTNTTASSSKKKKDILFILADDLGWNDVSWNNPSIKTPNLEKLRKISTPLNNYYTQQLCTPSRVAFLTGRYPIHVGLQHYVIVNTQPLGLPLEQKILPEYFNECGYDTSLIGKWHLGFYKNEYLPMNRGFHKFYGFLGAMEDHYSKEACQVNQADDVTYCGIDFFDGDKPSNATFGVGSSTIYVDYIKKILEKPKTDEKPKFIFYSTHRPHDPNEASPQFIEMYNWVLDEQRRTHMAMISELDHDIGRLLESVDMDNTIIIFSSDNGGETEFGGNNWPLNGQKWNFLEGGVRAVAYAYPPELFSQTSENLFHISDWIPSLMNAAGCEKNVELATTDAVDQIEKGREEILFNIDPLNTVDRFYNDYEKSISEVTGFDVRTEAALRVGHFKIITGFMKYGTRVKAPENGQTQHGIKTQIETQLENKFKYETDSKSENEFSESPVESDHVDNYNDQVNNVEVNMFFGMSIQVDLAGAREEELTTRTTKQNTLIHIFDLEKDPLEKNNLAENVEFLNDTGRRLLEVLAKHNFTAVDVQFPPHSAEAVPIDGFWQPWMESGQNV